MKAPTRQRRAACLLAGVIALVFAASVGTADAQVVDPIVFDVTPPTQTTTPGTQVDVTFTISDLPPCGEDEIVTLDTLDFELTDPSDLSTIAGFSTSEPPGTVAANFSPDNRALTLLFDSAFPCSQGATESITAVVTLDVPAGVPPGTQLSLDGVARGFASPPGSDYTVSRTGLVLVEAPPPPPDPVVVGVDSPQVTVPGGQATLTFTVSDLPPCAANELTSLDSADFALMDPNDLSTVDSFTTNEPPGTVSDNISPDGTELTLLFDQAFPCEEGTAAPVVIGVTIDVPAGVPPGTTLTLDGVFRGFATSTNQDYIVEAQGLVLVVEVPPPPPPPDGGNGSGNGGGPGGGSEGGGAVGGESGSGAVPAATPLRATPRLAG